MNEPAHAIGPEPLRLPIVIVLDGLTVCAAGGVDEILKRLFIRPMKVLERHHYYQRDAMFLMITEA